MIIKPKIQMSFSKVYVEKRTRKSKFLNQVDQIVDWNPIEKEIEKVYKKGKSADGRPSYGGLLLFKMTLLQTWYNLGDPGVEEMVNENLSAMVFCGLELEDDVPDHSVISRFRKELTEKKAYDRLLRKINKQIEKRGVIVKTGKAMIDASLTDTPRIPRGKTTYEVAEDRKENDRDKKEIDKENNQTKFVRKQQPGVDSEARWLKKNGKLHYGYKKHFATDENGLIHGVHTTTANEHDSKGLKSLLKKVDKKYISEGVYTDKGYKVPDNDELLKEQKVKNRIQYKAYRNKPLTEWQKQFNRLISKSRYVVERTFGSIKIWFGAGRARYVGKAKTHSQHVIEAIAYNLKRAPGIIVSNSLKT